MLATTRPLAGEEPSYGRSVFQAILDGLGPQNSAKAVYVCTEDGARVRDPGADGVLAWHPLCELMAPGSPDPLEEPWLPFPFTARQLAALLCDGWGYFICQAYGSWEDGPSLELMASIGPLGGKAREALTAAFKTFRYALEMAPRLDRSLERRATELAQQYEAAREQAIEREELREHRHSDAEYTARLARVNQAVADLGRDMKAARVAADLAYSRWRRALVQHLLLPIEEVPAESFENLKLRDVPPDRRAEAHHQMLALREFQDSAAGKAQWDLMAEIQGVEREIRYWQSFDAQNITEAGRRKDELKELGERLAELNAQVNGFDKFSGSTQPGSDVAQESTTQRQQRRLANLRALGGEWVNRGGTWRARDRQSGAFRKLVEQERSNGSRNCSEKSVRLDLCAAAEAEAQQRRSGLVLKGLASP